jgi:hypothetical protein
LYRTHDDLPVRPLFRGQQQLIVAIWFIVSVSPSSGRPPAQLLKVIVGEVAQLHGNGDLVFADKAGVEASANTFQLHGNGDLVLADEAGVGAPANTSKLHGNGDLVLADEADVGAPANTSQLHGNGDLVLADEAGVGAPANTFRLHDNGDVVLVDLTVPPLLTKSSPCRSPLSTKMSSPRRLGGACCVPPGS